MHEAASQGWTTRALERQIGTLYYDRLLASSDRTAVEQEAQSQLRPLKTPRDFVRDPVMLELLGVPGQRGCSKPIWTGRCWTTYRRSCLSLVAHCQERSAPDPRRLPGCEHPRRPSTSGSRCCRFLDDRQTFRPGEVLNALQSAARTHMLSLARIPCSVNAYPLSCRTRTIPPHEGRPCCGRLYGRTEQFFAF